MKTKIEPRPEVQAQRDWRLDLVDQLGPDLRQCVEVLHVGLAGDLGVVLTALRRCGSTPEIEQGVTFYWWHLVAIHTGRPSPLGVS